MGTPWADGAAWYMQGPFFEAKPEFGYQSQLTPKQQFRLGIEAIDARCQERLKKPFAELTPAQQDDVLKQIETGFLTSQDIPLRTFFSSFLLKYVMEGFFGDPMYGGNKNMAAWKMIAYPGVRADYLEWVGDAKPYPYRPERADGERRRTTGQRAGAERGDAVPEGQVVSSTNPSTFGQSVTFTATVTGLIVTPTGTVTFKDGATTLGIGSLNGSGQATFSTGALSAGDHSITAVYGGDLLYNPSTSSVLTQTVNQASSTTSVSSSANPSSFGQSVTFTATVTGSGATGTVTFKDGATTLGTGTLSSGTATFATAIRSMR
jgi:hypothetical protein